MMALNIAQLSYGIPGMLCYFLVFWALFRVRKSLNQSFIVIFTLLAAFNMVAWLNALLYLRFLNEPFFYFYYEWLSDKPFLINTHNFLASHFNYVQNIYLLLLTFDRYAAIFMITKGIKWWTNYYLHFIVATHVVVLGTHLSFRLPMANGVRLYPVTSSVQLFKEESDILRTVIDANVRLCFGIATFIICSILNILSLRILRRMKKSKVVSIQKSFFIISLCIFLTQAFNVFVSSLIAIFNTLKFSPGLSTAYDILPYLSDAMAIGPAIYTIVMPGLVRKFLSRKFTGALHIPMIHSQHSSSIKVTKHNTGSHT